MYHIKFPAVLYCKFKRIGLHEFKWVARLKVIINADDFGEAGAVVAHSCATSTAKEIK